MGVSGALVSLNRSISLMISGFNSTMRYFHFLTGLLFERKSMNIYTVKVDELYE